MPLLFLEALPVPNLEKRLGEKPALIVTSKSALRILAHTRRSLLQDSTTSALSVYAVGEESAALASRMGFVSVRSARGTLASLREEVRRHHPKSEPILHLCGKHRRGKLVESLQKWGYYARESVLYEAVSIQKLPRSACNILTPAMPSPLYASLFYSPRTADIFARLYACAFGASSMSSAFLRFFCLSPRIGVHLQRHFPQAQVVCAAVPSEASLFVALEQVYGKGSS